MVHDIDESPDGYVRGEYPAATQSSAAAPAVCHLNGNNNNTSTMQVDDDCNNTFATINTTESTSSTQLNQFMTTPKPFQKTTLHQKCLSDSILDSYKRSRSVEKLSNSTNNSTTNTDNSQPPPRNNSNINNTTTTPRRVATSGDLTIKQRQKQDTGPILSNSGWGAEASFGILQRSAGMKDEILACLSKIQESIKMSIDLQSSPNHTMQPNLLSVQTSSPSSSSSNTKNPQLLQFCETQIRQNLSKIILFVQDEYYRILIVNNQGIQTILTIMTLFPHHENLSATCNLALGIICSNSTQCQLQVIQCNGIYSIVASLRNFPRSYKVCSSGVDALSILSYNEYSVEVLCQKDVKLIELLNCVDEYLYPLSRQNRDILVSHLRRVCPCCYTTVATTTNATNAATTNTATTTVAPPLDTTRMEF